jgi:hypothetical protein
MCCPNTTYRNPAAASLSMAAASFSTSYALTWRAVAGSEREYVAGVQAVNLSPYEHWDVAEPLAMLPEGTRAGASFPLGLALAALADCMRDPAWSLGAKLRTRLD